MSFPSFLIYRNCKRLCEYEEIEISSKAADVTVNNKEDFCLNFVQEFGLSTVLASVLPSCCKHISIFCRKGIFNVGIWVTAAVHVIRIPPLPPSPLPPLFPSSSHMGDCVVGGGLFSPYFNSGTCTSMYSCVI
jgi:hypothetical protein